MSRKSLGAQLLHGSHNIDQMKKEVRELVGMLRGLIENLDLPLGYRCDTLFKGEGVEWRLGVRAVLADKSIIFVQCWLVEEPSSKLLGFSTDGPLRAEAETIQRVYESWDILVRGIRGIFPQLEPKLKPFFDAAELSL